MALYKRQFGLDDAYLADLKAELMVAQRLAVEEHGQVLVWTGGATSVMPLISTLRSLCIWYAYSRWRYARCTTSSSHGGMLPGSIAPS